MHPTLRCLFLLFLTPWFSLSQETSLNIGLDTTHPDRQEIIKLWTDYLASDPDTPNDSPYWSVADKRRYKSYDLLKSEGYLSPSLYYFGLSNKILSISRVENGYLIRSTFYDPTESDIYAITNVLAVRQDGKFTLTNYQSLLTKDWNTETIGLFRYHYFPGYILNVEKAKKANVFLSELCTAFGIAPEPIEYFICRDCEDVFRTKGYDYVLGMGNATECGFFDKWNNIIYATEKGGEDHQHEITHVINTTFPDANDLLLAGLSAYWGNINGFNGRPLLYHVKRVGDYLHAHPEIDLVKPTEFWKMDEDTNPQYVIGGILCHVLLERGGTALLKSAFSATKTEEELVDFYVKTFGIEKNHFNDFLRKKIDDVAKRNRLDIIHP